MKEIRIKISEEDYEQLLIEAEILSKYRGGKITPNRIVQQFICDLTYSVNSGGSDERDLAHEWFNRSRYNF